MPTNEERREVARRLRGDPYDTLIPYRTGIHFGMGCHEAANRFWDMCERIKSAGDYDIAYSTRYMLADLIEPEPERTCNVIFRSHEMSQTQTVLAKSCSGCGFEFGTEIKNTFPFEVTINSISISNYCPNCGAKVIKE